MAANKQKNGTNGAKFGNGHVSLAREEYDAFMAREDSFTKLSVAHANLRTSVDEQNLAMQRQVTVGVGQSLRVTNLERIAGLQAQLIAHLTEKTTLAKLEDLSEFWRQWVIHTGNATIAGKLTHAEVSKLEPDLFKSWRLWVHNAGKADRFSLSGTRQEIETAAPKNQFELQEHMIRRLNEENANLAGRIRQLEAQLGPPLNDAKKEPVAKGMGKP